MWDPYSEFESETLPNGLTVHAAHWPGRPWEAMGFLIHSGAEEDPVGLEGLAHFVEHLVSKNTSVPYKDLSDFFDNCGGDADFGGTNHAFTRYRFFVPTDEKILSRALDLFGAMLLTGKLENFVERERQVIVGEFHRYFPQKFRFDLNTRESRALYSGYWLERYCSPLGNPESVGRISESDLQSFYDRHYTPANISVVGVGGLKLLELMRLLSKSPFAIRKEGKRTVLPKKVSEVSPPLENRCVFEMSSEMQTPTEVGDYRSVAKLPGAVNGRAVNLLSHMLDKVLKEEVRERRAWAYHIDSDWNYFRHFYEFEIECQSLALCALDTIEEVVETCITSLNDREDLFERTKRSALAGTYLVDPNAHDICNGAMSDLAKHQRIVTLHEYYKQYKQLKMDDIRGLLHSLRPEMRYTLIIRP